MKRRRPFELGCLSFLFFLFFSSFFRVCAFAFFFLVLPDWLAAGVSVLVCWILILAGPGGSGCNGGDL
jgi:hypothetical protein